MKTITRYAILFFLLCSGACSYSQIEIILRRSFIDSIKNTVTIKADYTIDFAHKRVNPPSKDGDIHIAGHAGFIGLPVVAEIMNAKFQKPAVQLVHQNEGKGTPVQMTGVWRLWCEHASNGETQEQGAKVVVENTNPPHVFEIHPVLQLNNINLIESLNPIEGFQYKNANDAFDKYSTLRCKLDDLGDKIKITTNGAGYNYVEFWIEILDDIQFTRDDGRFVMCTVLNEDQEMLYSKMRMVFPKGSQAEVDVSTLKKGDVMHVVGIPRIDLALVTWRIDHAKNKPDLLNWNLPIEMIIVASIPEQ